jgi:hypothetical protein
VKPDIVYVVRAGERNEELRYSIRSLRNLPHGKVWIAGYCPKWLGNDIGVIKTQTRPGGHVSAKANLRAACEHPEVSESFVYMNDDFFIMQPHETLPVMHRGSLADAAKNDRMASSYQRAMGKTLAILEKQGIKDSLMYELHGPMTVTKAGMLEALALCNYPMIQERTIFGNMQGVGGEKRHNHKVRRQDRGWSSWPFISTNDNTFRTLPVGEYIRSKFSEASPFEVSPPIPVKGTRHAPPGAMRRPIRRHVSTIQRIGGRAA